jgi:hypothetical protein
VISVQGCFERTTFIWKAPNTIDFHFPKGMFRFPSVEACVQNSKDDMFIALQRNASDVDILTFEHFCRTVHFDVVCLVWRTWCDVVWQCGVVWCGVMWCGVM